MTQGEPSVSGRTNHSGAEQPGTSHVGSMEKSVEIMDAPTITAAAADPSTIIQTLTSTPTSINIHPPIHTPNYNAPTTPSGAVANVTESGLSVHLLTRNVRIPSRTREQGQVQERVGNAALSGQAFSINADNVVDEDSKANGKVNSNGDVNRNANDNVNSISFIKNAPRPAPMRAMSSSAAQSPFISFPRANANANGNGNGNGNVHSNSGSPQAASIWHHEHSPSYNRVSDLREGLGLDVGVIGGSRNNNIHRVEDRSSSFSFSSSSFGGGGGDGHSQTQAQAQVAFVANGSSSSHGYGSHSAFRDGPGRPWEDGGSRNNSFSAGQKFVPVSPIGSLNGLVNTINGNGVPTIVNAPMYASPFPTFSDTSSPPVSPMGTLTQLSEESEYVTSAAPRPEMNVSRSRSQSMATGLRPTLGSGLIPMPMSQLMTNTNSNSSPKSNSKAQRTPWPTTSGATGGAGAGNSQSPFSRVQRISLTHAESFDGATAAREHQAHAAASPGNISGNDNGNHSTSDRWLGPKVTSPSAHAGLTDSVHAALGEMASFNPHHGTAAFDDPLLSNYGGGGGISGTSSRRHSISIASGPHARRGFNLAGFGFSDSISQSNATNWNGRQAGYPNGESAINDQFTSALSLQLNEQASQQTPASLATASGSGDRRSQLNFVEEISNSNNVSTNNGGRIADHGESRFDFAQNYTLNHPNSHNTFVPPRMSTENDMSPPAFNPYGPESNRQDHPVYPFGQGPRPNGSGISVGVGGGSNANGNPHRAIGSALLNPESSPYVGMNRQPNGHTGGAQMRQLPPQATYATSNGIQVYGPGMNMTQNFAPFSQGYIAPRQGLGGYPNGMPNGAPNNGGNARYPASNGNGHFMPNQQGTMSGSGPSFAGSIGSGPSASHNPLNDLGKGIPLSMITSDTRLFIVEFKAQRTDLFYCLDRTVKIDVGDYVIVEADRGQDLGKVTNNTITLEEVKSFAAYRKQELANLSAGLAAGPKVQGTFAGLHAGLNMMGQQSAQGGAADVDDMPGGMQQSAAIKGLSKEIMPKRIFGKAGQQDQQ